MRHLKEVFARRSRRFAAEVAVLSLKQRGEALCEEKEHVMTVLAEWQHYGRTRNTDFENALKAVQQKDHEIAALKHQVSTNMIKCPVAMQLHCCCTDYILPVDTRAIKSRLRPGARRRRSLRALSCLECRSCRTRRLYRRMCLLQRTTATEAISTARR